MFIVKLATSITKSVTDSRLRRAERKNSKAMSKLQKAKSNLVSSNIELAATQVEVASQLTKLTTVSHEIGAKMKIQASKQEKLAALLEDLS